MANAWEQVDLIAAEALTIMSDSMVIGGLTMRDKTSDFNTTPNGYTVGDTVRIKTRPDYTVNEFSSTIAVQDIRESTRSMSIEKHFDVSVEITAKEKALDLESLTEQVVSPAARRLAEQVDSYLGTKISLGAGMYASDALFGDAADIAQARKTATIQQLEMDRFCLVDLDLEAALLGQTWFNQSQTRGAPGVSTLQSGMMGSVMGMDFYSSINFDSFTGTGGTGAATTNNGAGNIVGNTGLIYDGGTGTFEVGDRLAVAGVSRPLIVATQTTGATGTIPLQDPITEIIPDNAAITVIGTGQAMTCKGAIFDSRSIAAAFPVLDSPSDKPSYVVSDNGVSIRVVQGYDMQTKKETLSMDLLIGATAYDPRRITLLTEY